MDTNPLAITLGEACPQLRRKVLVPGGAWFPGNDAVRHQIVVSLPDISPREGLDLGRPLLVDLCRYEDLLFLVMDTVGGLWVYEMPWTCIVGGPTLEPGTPLGNRLVSLVGMDHTTGVVKVARTFTWPADFADQIETEFARLQNAPITWEQFWDQMAEVTMAYPNGVRALSIASCHIEMSEAPGSGQWRLDSYGSPLADVICPHGVVVDRLNFWDHSLDPDQQTYRISQADLLTYLIEWQDSLADACAHHSTPDK